MARDHKVKAGVSVVLQSANAKLGSGVSATYVSQSTCPASCPLQGAGCYAEHGGPLGYTTRQRNAAGADTGPLELLQREADGIDGLPARRGLLRVHVVGDVLNAAGAAIIAGAMQRYDRRGGTSWTYTHAWREVPRAVWGAANVLASCESPQDVRDAHAAGYAAALVVESYPTPRAYDLDGLTVIPCPWEAGTGGNGAGEGDKGATCRDCGLCTRVPFLEASGRVIAFAAHGSKRATVQRIVREKSAGTGGPNA